MTDTMDNKKRAHLQITFQRALENALPLDQMQQLHDTLISDPQARQLYIDYLMVHGSLFLISRETLQNAADGNPESIFDTLLSLSQNEQTAPAIEPPAPDKNNLPPDPVQPPPPPAPYQSNRLHLISAIASAAALIAIVLYIELNSHNSSCHFSRATLVNQTHAQWAQPDSKLDIGQRLYAHNPPYILEDGIINIRHDDGVDIIIEGPASFTIERSGLYLKYGRCYNRVSKSGRGFRVETPTSLFTDYGTEFGVQADSNGSSELHVIKGKVQVLASPPGGSRLQQMVTADHAVRFNANSQQLQTIPVLKSTFARKIDIRTKRVWRGQMQIDLADIVSGGDGFNNSSKPLAIHPGTGIISYGINPGRKSFTSRFHPVPANPLIDGVFVPNGQTTPQPITSTGLTFDQCPPTNSNCFIEIHNSARSLNNDPSQDLSPIVLNGIAYTQLNRDALVIHANAGITFDLHAIRLGLPNLKLDRFKTLCGTPPRDLTQKIDLWILLDGQIRFHQTFAGLNAPVEPVDFDLPPQARFLTLIATDAAYNPDPAYADATFYDWGIFAQARLTLTSATP